MSDVLQTLQDGCQQAMASIKDLSQQAPGTPTQQALVVGVVVGFLAYKLTQKRYKLPPGPFALPLLGNVLSMRSSTEPFYVTLRRWAKEKYGPVVRVYFGPLLCVTLNDVTVATEAFVKKADDYAGRPYLHSLHELTDGSKSIVFADYNPVWKLQRKVAMQALRHYMSGSYLEHVVHDVIKMVGDKMAAEAGPFDPTKYTSTLMFHIIFTICFADTKALDDPELKRQVELFDKVNSEFGNGFFEDLFPPLRLCPTPRYRRVMTLFREFLDFLEKHVTEHRATFSPSNIRDLTDSILLAQTEAARAEGSEVMTLLTDTHVSQTISDMFGAGVDTSRMTLNWALLYLAAHPQIQKKAQDEIDAVTGSRMPALGDRHRLPYTLAVVYETLRLGVIVPTALPHKTLCDTTVGGYEIPKGTMVMVNQWALQHDPDTHTQPEQFNPQRFLDQQGQLKKTDSWTPFSAGRRSCLGEAVAKPEILLILSCLLKRFTISLPEGAVGDLDCNAAMGMTLHIPKPYTVVMKER